MQTLDYHNNSFSGTLPAGRFESLLIIDIRNNSFYGPIPSDINISTLV